MSKPLYIYGPRRFHSTWDGANRPSGCRVTAFARIWVPGGNARPGSYSNTLSHKTALISDIQILIVICILVILGWLFGWYSFNRDILHVFIILNPGLGSIQFRNWNCSSIPIPIPEWELENWNWNWWNWKWNWNWKPGSWNWNWKPKLNFCHCYRSTYWLTNHFQILALTEFIIFHVTDSLCNTHVLSSWDIARLWCGHKDTWAEYLVLLE